MLDLTGGPESFDGLEGDERRHAFSHFRHVCWFDSLGEPSDEAIEAELETRGASG